MQRAESRGRGVLPYRGFPPPCKKGSAAGYPSRKKTPAQIQTLAWTNAKEPGRAQTSPDPAEELPPEHCLRDTSLHRPKECTSQRAWGKPGNETAMSCADPHPQNQKKPHRSQGLLKSFGPSPQLVSVDVAALMPRWGYAR